VFPCLSFRSAARDASLGRVTERSFREIWEHAALLGAIRRTTRAELATCSTCDGRDTCRPCMAHNFRDHGSLVEPAASTCELTASMLRDRRPDFVPASRLRRA
jgi:radical SAM protein with 4Fe4S-binding SPASM domain